ncbi:efflux RND transporter periplasmic adaptor subunit [uncultured Bacteroides sp.]|uniref:efflux RND transporter periplasmic adaptor subunit n=1 Tax=uncultured Bacteroides sp. TaxID=162156 RepID=UPI002AAB7FE0|nr:efflux RND transporter periplasmic adaptor subunit [uncultured Bacteroides sp.]
MKQYICAGTIMLLALASCNHQSKEHTHEHEADKHDHEAINGKSHEDEIILSKTKAEMAGVKVVTLQPQNFHQIIKTSGKILPAQGDESVVVATMPGIVSFQQKRVAGVAVNRGSRLLTISSQNIVNGDPVQKARIDYETAQKEFERMKTLVKNQIVSEKEFNLAKQNYENARISYQAVAKNHSGNGQIVSAPISGFIKSVMIKEGDYVETGQPLMTISQNRKLLLQAEVSEKYYSALKHISSGNFKTPYSETTYALSKLNGKLLSFGKAADDNSYYIPVIFEFDNKEGIIPGSYVEVYLQSGSLGKVIALPHSAITEEQGLYFAYLQVDEEGYKKQEIELGADDGENVEIVSGLKEGDRVVISGAYHIKLASASNAIPAHSHEH